MSDEYISPVPQALRSAIAINKDRSAVSKTTPQIDGMMREASAQLEKIVGTKMPARGYTILSEDIFEVLEESFSRNEIDKSKVCPYAIILELPGCFEDAIATMAIQKPHNFNWNSTSLREAKTYFSWKCCLPVTGESDATFKNMEVWVRELELRGITKWNIWSPGGEWSWCWQPVVFLAGRRMSVGGFAVDEALICSLQATSAAVYSFPPAGYYSDQDFAQAAQDEMRLGPHPWYHSVWRMEDADVLGVHILQCSLGVTDERQT